MRLAVVTRQELVGEIHRAQTCSDAAVVTATVVAAAVRAGMEQLRSSQSFLEAVAIIRAAAMRCEKENSRTAPSTLLGVQPRWRAVGEE
eukprot:261619-Pleurochrysis_carterae.AAC.1